MIKEKRLVVVVYHNWLYQSRMVKAYNKKVRPKVSLSSSIFPIYVMYLAREREWRILAQRCEKLSHGLWVLEEEVDKCRRLFYDLQASWKKEVQRQKKIKDEGEPLLLSFKSMYTSG